MEGKQAYERMKNIEQNKDWEKYDSKPCEMYKMQIDGRTASKGECIVNYNIEEVYKFLADSKTMKLLNSQVNKTEDIQLISETLRIEYQGYDGIWPVAGRDFVMVTLH